MAYTYDLTTPETVTRRPGMPPEGTSVDHTVSQTTLTPVNSKYIPGTMLTGVMNQANLIMGKYNNTSKFGLYPSNITTASPKMQNAAMSAFNNSSFNFDAPVFDPNAGRLEAYDREYAKYMSDLRNSGRRRINLKRANRAFEQRFNETWQQGELGRRNAYLADRKQKNG